VISSSRSTSTAWTRRTGRRTRSGSVELWSGLKAGNVTDVDIVVFIDTFTHVGKAMDRLRAWSTEVVRRAMTGSGQPPTGGQPLLPYLESTLATPSEKQRCFQEMLEFLQDTSA
jgi:hypothetical protein